MISRINTTKLIFLGLALGLGSCKNQDQLMETGKNTPESTVLSEEKSGEKRNVKNTGQYINPTENGNEVLDQNADNYQVHGTDENGNQVSGSVNIEGAIGIGIISGTEAKGIEIVAERIGQNQFIATDVKGYEYKLKVDPN